MNQRGPGLGDFGGALAGGAMVALFAQVFLATQVSREVAEPGRQAPPPVVAAPDRHTSLKDGCAYLDTALAAEFVRTGRPSAAAAGNTRRCTWHAERQDPHPGRYVRVNVTLTAPDRTRGGTVRAASAFAASYRAAEEQARPGELPVRVPGLGDEGFATVTGAAGDRHARVQLRRANVMIEIVVGEAGPGTAPGGRPLAAGGRRPAALRRTATLARELAGRAVAAQD